MQAVLRLLHLRQETDKMFSAYSEGGLLQPQQQILSLICIIRKAEAENPENQAICKHLCHYRFLVVKNVLLQQGQL